MYNDPSKETPKSSRASRVIAAPQEEEYNDSCGSCGVNDMDCECSDGYMRRGLRSL